GQLTEHALGDVVVAAPVGGPLGERELVQVVTAALRRQSARLGRDLRCQRDEVAAAAVELDEVDLLLARRPGHDRHERQAEHPREVGLGDGGRATGGLYERGALADQTVYEAVEDQRTRKAVLEG